VAKICAAKILDVLVLVSLRKVATDGDVLGVNTGGRPVLQGGDVLRLDESMGCWVERRIRPADGNKTSHSDALGTFCLFGQNNWNRALV
jgi:hypothetical protein